MRDPIPREELLDALQQFADELDHTPTTREMRDHGPHSASIYSDKFGTWFQALDAAGLDPDARGKTPSDEKLLAELRRLADELGHTPTIREMRQHGKHSDSTYKRRFGSWSEAVSEAGLTPNRSGLSAEYNQIIQQLREAEQ